jgi:putative transposase
MARLPRLALAGQVHLATLYGLGGQAVVADDADRRLLLSMLREVAGQQHVAVHAYVLLDDHVHLLLTPASAGGLGLLMQGLGRRYVAAFNRRHHRRGTLWAGRYRATVVQPGERQLEALLFVDQHPARSGQVAAAEDFEWSSARHHAGLRRDPLITDGDAYWQLGNTPFDREAAYRRLLAEGLSPGRARTLADAARKGWAVGDEAFLTALGQQSARPLRPRRRGRPARRPD